MKKLLLIDADPLGLCVLEVGLRKAGYIVTTATDAVDGLEKIDGIAPDVIVTDTRLPGVDGIALVRAMRERPALADIPVVFLASRDSEEDRNQALELGIDDYLAKPVYLAELTARIQLLLARRARQSMESQASAGSGRGRVGGSTHDLALVDLLQSFEASRKSGVVLVRSGMQEARIYVRHGTVVDAELGPLRGEEAIYRALIWDEASFDVEFRPVTNEDTIGCSTQALVMKSMRRVDEWVRLCAQVQPLAALLDVHPPQLLERLSALSEIPEAWRAMVRLPARGGARPELSPGTVVLREDMTARDEPEPVLEGPTPEPVEAEREVTTQGPEAAPAEREVAAAAPEVPAIASSWPSAFVPEPEAPVVAAPPARAEVVAATAPPAAEKAPAPPPSKAVPAEAVAAAPRASQPAQPDAAPPSRSTANGAHAPLAPHAYPPAAQAKESTEPAPRHVSEAPASPAAAPVNPPRLAEPPPRPAPATAPAPREPVAAAPAQPVAAAPKEPTEQPVPPPARVPSLRPSAAPWTREVSAAAESPVDADSFAAGVPRAMTAKTKLVGGAAVLGVAGLLVAFGLNAARSRQIREAEEARSKNVAVVGTAAFARASAPAPTVVPAAPPAALPEPPAALPEEVPVPVASATHVAEGVVSPPPPNAGGATPAVVAPELAALPATPAAVPAANAHETAINVTTAMHSQSPLIRDAQRALLKGDTAHAAELAQKAVVKDPGDADAWLTLAAARKASGDMTGAADAYSGCIAKAQTVSVTSCRVLAKMHGVTTEAHSPRLE